jgi:outer membrane protein OmpA-like peptidoglycan-associated protein
VKFVDAMVGPVFRYPMAGLSPFLHADVGLSHMSLSDLGGNNGAALAAGGGLDFAAPSWTRLKLRLIDAQLVYSHHNFFPVLPRPNFTSAKLSTGLVFTAGQIAPAIPPTVACQANPTEVFPGEPVNITVTPSNFNPKRTVSYSYTATGGKVSGNAANTTVDTNGMNAGNYTVTATATDNHVKVPPTCTANFTVKEWPAPTVSCSANPTEVDPGQPVTINCNGSTTKGNLTYAYKASSGQVSGEGPNATLNTQGAQPGPITVTGTVTDERGKTASADTTVNVRAPQAPPPPPPPPQASKINQIAFTKTYSSRVDNAAKAILDDVALRLQREPDSKLVIVGSTDGSKEKSKTRLRNLAAQRAVNTKAYLVNEKGIDANRIETRTDGTEGAQAEMWIVPQGANFNEPNTEVTSLPTPKPHAAPRGHRRSTSKKATGTQAQH